jgi:hypothetical protein
MALTRRQEIGKHTDVKGVVALRVELNAFTAYQQERRLSRAIVERLTQRR